MAGFQVHLLGFRAEVTAPLRLPPASGAALRGALFAALRGQFCLAGRGPACGSPALAEACPVCFLLAPVDERDPRGKDVPRPYVLRAPASGPASYAPGQTLEFGLATFGRALSHFPYALMGVEEMGRQGLGVGRHGAFRLEEVWAEHPLLGRQEAVYQRTRGATVRAPALPVEEAHVLAEADRLAKLGGARRLRLELLSPTRLVDRAALVKPETFALRPLLARLLERLSALSRRYGDGAPRRPASAEEASGPAGGTIAGTSPAGHPVPAPPVAPPIGAGDALAPSVQPSGPPAGGASAATMDPHAEEGVAALLRASEAVQVVERHLTWRELFRASGRHGRLVPMSGLVGSVVLEGDLAPTLPWLVWGTLTHVGKDAAMGNGRLYLEPLP